MNIYLDSLKISIMTAFLLSLIIPFLIKPVNGLYDIGELQSLRAYCFLHADRAAQGENVVNDLIKSGLADSKYQDWSCVKISETLEAEEQAAAAQTQVEAHGYIDPEKYRDFPALYNKLPRYNAVESLLDYCYLHASDSLNPVQDLIDKGLLSQESQELIFSGWLPNTDCKTVEGIFDTLDYEVIELIKKYSRGEHILSDKEIKEAQEAQMESDRKLEMFMENWNYTTNSLDPPKENKTK